MNLSDNYLTFFPDSFADFTEITAIYLSGNQFTEGPASLASLISLSELHLGNNRLAELLGVVVISSDVLAALGVRSLLEEWGVDLGLVLWCIPPRCNALSFQQWMAFHRLGPLHDTRSIEDIDTLAATIVARISMTTKAEYHH